MNTATHLFSLAVIFFTARFSIGIEIVNTKTESPAGAQYLALTQLVRYLQQEYDIPLENILGHKDVAPDRKTDPWHFDWEYFKSLLE